MTVAKAEGGSTRIEIIPPVVRQSDSESSILSTIVVGVTDERCLPVGVDFAVGHSDTRTPVSDI